MGKIICLLGILGFMNYSLFAQKHDNVWFVGHEYFNDTSAILNFSTPNVSINSIQRHMPMFRTNTSVCDSLGNLQFYTNGLWIHNAQHQMMQNGDSLNPGVFANNNRAYGNCVPDGAIVIPHPKQTNKYYLFHQSYEQSLSSAGFGENLYYTLVDMNANSGLGRVEKKNQFLVSDSICSGQLEVVKHGNGRDWWLIQPMAASNGYYTFLITEDTIILASKQYIGNANRVIKYEWLGQATFTPDGNKYLRFDHENDFDIFDFNRCTGVLSNYLHIPVIDSVDNIQFSSIASGVAISSSNQYAYVSSFLNLYQFDLWASDIAASKITVAVYDSFTDGVLQTTFSYLQLAPDNKIYIHAYGPRYLHVINNPDLAASSCDVQQHGVYIYHYNSLAPPNHPHYRTPALAGSPCDTLTAVAQPTLAQAADIKLYPNPASHSITLESSSPLTSGSIVAIYNAIGQEVLQQKIIRETTVLDLDIRSLIDGVYIVQIEKDRQRVSRVFVVSKK